MTTQSLFLAFGAIPGAPSALRDPTDGSAGAFSTLLSFAAIDVEARGEIAQLAVGLREVAQRRAAIANRLLQHFADRRHQAFELRLCDLATGFARMDARAPQRLGHIDIAEPGHDALVEQAQLDRLAASLERRFELRGAEIGPERFGA